MQSRPRVDAGQDWHDRWGCRTGGDVISYSYLVTNSGNVTLHGITL